MTERVFTVNVHTENEAFGDEPAYELARILRKIADRIDPEREGESFDMFQTIHDANGNDVGRYAIKPADYR